MSRSDCFVLKPSTVDGFKGITWFCILTLKNSWVPCCIEDLRDSFYFGLMRFTLTIVAVVQCHNYMGTSVDVSFYWPYSHCTCQFLCHFSINLFLLKRMVKKIPALLTESLTSALLPSIPVFFPPFQIVRHLINSLWSL